MTNIIRIESNIPKDVLRIELFLSNVCNYNCWYCFPGSHEGDVKWPEFNKIVNNLSYLIDYYKSNAGKKQINLHIIGGEPTLWKDFGRFVEYFKKNHSCVISMSSNGSRTIRWWEEFGHYVDHVMISCHHERVDTEHIIGVGDLLYKKDVTVNGMVLMDPTNWDRCTNIVNKLKASKYRWPITAVEVYHDLSKYTQEQKSFLKTAIKRYPELNYWLRSSKLSRSKPTVYFDDRTDLTVERNWLSLNNKNYFAGWECNIGVDTFFIDKHGYIKGACGQHLFDIDYLYNIYDFNFVEKFNPKIIPTICRKIGSCDCQPETNTRKRFLLRTKKIIPISSV